MMIMKKVFLLLLLSIGICGSAFSQAAIAKLKYEEAEEAFAANDCITAIARLDETENMLGQTNPRILYLRIAAQNKLRKTQGRIDLEMVRALKKNCQTYLVKYESVEGIEEKYKEVYKISEAIKGFNTADKAFANIAKELPADMDSIGNAYYSIDNYVSAMEWYKKAAAKNDAFAIMKVGAMYGYGEGVKEDNVKALEYFQKANALNDPSAMYFTYLVYNYAWDVPRDSVKADEWLRKSYEVALPGAEKGNPLSMYAAGRALAYMPKPDYDKALEWLQKAADKGYIAAIEMIASWYMSGIHVEKDPSRALELYKKGAALGDCSCMYAIGYQYYTGKAISKDLAKAMEWFSVASDHGSSPAAFYMGYMYANAEGVERDYTQAASYYTIGGERNNRSCINNLGVLYENGNGVPKDYAKAISCYERAAALGNEYAMNNLGLIYKNGTLGTTVNYPKAFEWFKKGAEAGHAAAVYSYATALYEGKGTAQDYPKAIEWFTKAANKGNKDAIDKLYAMYYYGLGVKKDKKIAQEWLNKKYATN